MVKKRLRKFKVKQRDTLSREGHMEVFKRLARIRNMHGAPGPRKKKTK